MAFWSWFLQRREPPPTPPPVKPIGENVRDYGKVFETDENGSSVGYHVQVTHEAGKYYLLVKKSSAGPSGSEVLLPPVAVTPESLKKLGRVARDAAEAILERRAEDESSKTRSRGR